MAAGPEDWSVSKWMAVAALLLATLNVVGGYVVTDRMLQMFKKKKK